MSKTTTSYLDPDTLAALGSLELRARMIVEGLMIGMHRSPYQGFSTEFAQHRPYTPGDDLRHLDWKVYIRTNKLYLKQFQKETNLRLIVLVDASGSMGYGSDTVRNWRKYDLAAAFAAAIAYLAVRQQDRVQVALFDRELIAQTALSNAHDHWRSVVEVLSSVTELSQESVDSSTEPVPVTDLARLFDQVTAKLTHRSLVVLISDLFDEMDALEHGLARLYHRRHDLIVFHTLDHAELTFPFRAPAQFMGLEDEGRLNLDPMALKRIYLEAIEDHWRQAERITRRFGFDYLKVDTSHHVGAPLSRFIARRAALIGKGK